MTSETDPRQAIRQGLRTWFRSPPRPHGDVNYDREVSFLELFYDLVYVVLIAQAAHHLAVHLDRDGVLGFAVVFSLIWLSWFNGTFWHEIHSRDDGRSRNYIFAQMMLLALLAVFAGDATGDDGPAFALTYAVLFALYTWQWYTVHRIDDVSYRPRTTRYLRYMVTTVVVMGVSAFVGETARLWIWGVLVVVWIVAGYVSVRDSDTAGFGQNLTASMVERFGLFTIIVLGEVVVGVVSGLSEVEERSAMTLVTGVLALTIGFGLWWNYFDTLGRRIPEQSDGRLAGWLFAHLPLTMGIAAGGAATVSLVEHAADIRTPAPTAWLLAASVALALAGVAVAARALSDDEFPPGVAPQIAPTFVVAMAAIVLIGALRPVPIVLVVTVSLLLALTWFRLFVLFLAGSQP